LTGESDGAESTVGTCRVCTEELAINDASHRAEVLAHYLEKHPDSETLSEALGVLKTQTVCSACGTEFVATPSIGRDAGVSPLLYLPAVCDDCTDDDPLYSLLVEETTPAEVVPDGE